VAAIVVRRLNLLSSTRGTDHSEVAKNSAGLSEAGVTVEELNLL
jgi:hypothetical protein